MKEVAKPNALPSIVDLYNDVEWAAKQNDLNRLLNQEPSPKWIKQHPFVKDLKYLPIDRVEWLLTNIFLKWWVSVKECKVIANSVQVTLTLYAIDPITGTTLQQDGIGCVDIQTAKGAEATDFNKITPFAVMKAAPAAKSYAIKDAAENFGKLFGKDLNRKDFIAYTNLDGKFDLAEIPCTQEQTNHLYTLLNNATMSHDERDEFQFRIQKGVSIEEYHLIRQELADMAISALDRVRNGDNMSQKELSQAIKQRID